MLIFSKNSLKFNFKYKVLYAMICSIENYMQGEEYVILNFM